MCAAPPKPKNQTPAPVEAPVLDLATPEGVMDIRKRSRRGRNQLRSDFGLNIPSAASGLNIPQE
jgi:hypothetical protein